MAIGITADSFIVFFERVRDEVREGRSLRAAVETGWARARRTILAADSVSFLAAVVLYILATGSVRRASPSPSASPPCRRPRGLPLHPADARRCWPGRSSSAAGTSSPGSTPRTSAGSVAYAGRGRIRTPSGAAAARDADPARAPLTLAERRAERERAASGNAPPAPQDRVEQTTTSGRES